MNYSNQELQELLGGIGTNVHIHRSVAFFNPKNIFIGSNVRIDCFCLLSAGKEGIHIGDYIHIAASTHLFGSGGLILLESFSSLSSRVSLFTSSDDYIEGYMTNPIVKSKYRKIQEGPIHICRHAIIGCGSVVLPNVTVELGGSIGALSLVKQHVSEFSVVGGVPARYLKQRDKHKLLDLEKIFINEKNFHDNF